MATLQELSAAFRQTFDDKLLSGPEQTALRSLLAESGMDKTKRDFLASHCFDIAEAALGKGRDTQIIAWLKTANQILSDSLLPSFDKDETFFSPGPDCLGAITHAIGKSRKTLDICVFTISDDRIRDAILTRKAMGTRIRIITDNEKLLDEGSDIQTLDKAGIEIRVDRTTNHMHHKFAIFDQDRVLTGSYNWTRSAEAYNHENVLFTMNPTIVRQFQDTFEGLWREMKPF